MLKKHMAACLVATAFAALPALAQTTPPPASGGTDRPAATGTGTATSGSSAMQPSASSSSTPTTPMAQSSGGASQGQFMTQMQPNHMMASSLIGTTVVSANNESIGDVNDVILDRNGQAMAAVIGVGGFLGIGEKDVAVPFQALDFNAQPQMSSSNMSGGTNPPASTSTAPATTGSTASNTATATTGNTGNSGTSAAANASNNSGGVPDRVMLKMTKAELQAAPTFQKSARNANGNTGTTSTAPKP